MCIVHEQYRAEAHKSLARKTFFLSFLSPRYYYYYYLHYVNVQYSRRPEWKSLKISD